MRVLGTLLAAAFLGLAGLGLTGNVGAESLPEPRSYLTGNEYLKLSEIQRQAYVMGLVDGIGLGRWSVLVLPDKMGTVYKRITECTERWSVNETTAVVDQFLNENQQFRETLVPMSADLALSIACHLGRH